MKKLMKFIFFLSVVSLFLAGCQGCFDGEITRRVDYPYVTVTENTNYEITFNSATKEAQFKYTIDGTDPTTSETAVAGTTVTIDFLTEVKVYAFKDGMRNSETVYYRIPATNAVREVNYKPDNMYVDTHCYTADDVFGREKIEITYNGKGADDQWFSSDDTVSEYRLYNYTENTLTNSKHYNGPGADGKWFTTDDASDSYSEFALDAQGRKSTENIFDAAGNKTGSKTYTWWETGNSLASLEEFDSGGSSVNKVEYTYVNNPDAPYTILQTETYTGTVVKTVTYDAVGTQGYLETANINPTGFIDITNAYELNKRYKQVLTYNGEQIEKKVLFLGYGEDTDVGLTTYVYDEAGMMSEEHVFSDKAGTYEVKFTYFTYDGDKLSQEEIHERYWDKEYYDWEWKITIKQYQYNEDGTVSRIDYYNDEKFMSQYDLYTYTAGNTYMDTFERPELPKKTINVDLEVESKDITGGQYSMDGQNFDINGDPIGEIIDISPDQQQFFKDAKAKIEEIIKNTEVDAQGLTITGEVAGSIRIEGDAYNKNSTNYIKVWFYFEDYDDGDMMIDGELISEFQGQFDISGKVKSYGKGYIQGSVVVTDGNPDWTDEDYNQIYYTASTLDGNMNPTEEIIYNGSGTDGVWTTVEDNPVEKYILYTTNGSVKTKSVRKNSGSDKTWGTADDVEYERFVEEYSGSVLVKEEYYSIYGTYTREFNGTTVNDPLVKAQLKYDTWCHWGNDYGWWYY